jgi:tetratricopeptide (TPR) repeat protein
MADPDPKPPKPADAPTLVADLGVRRELPGLPPEMPQAPPPDQQSSLALLAKDLMPPPTAPAQPTLPAVPQVADRRVPGPGFKIAARNWLRRYAGKLRTLLGRNRMASIAAAGTLLVVIVLAIVLTRGGDDSPTRGEVLAQQGQELINSGSPKKAAELLESELVGDARPDDAQAYLVLGHARFANKRYLEALTAYERALTLLPRLASDTVLRANASKILESKDTVAGVVAIELLASRVSPPAHDVVIEYASRGKLAEVRRRAFAIAEREGFADKVDRVDSWSLDLSAASTCADRRALVAKLASTGDRRALPALKRAKLYKCAEKDASQAIAEIERGGSDFAK